MSPIQISGVLATALVLAGCGEATAPGLTSSKPATSALPQGVFYDLSGHNGGGQSDPFRVSGGDWEVAWSYSCLADAADAPFPVGVYDKAGHLHPGGRVEQFHVDVKDSSGNVVDEVDQTDRMASGVNTEPMGTLHLSGTFLLVLFTGPNCDWHVTARAATATSG